MAIAFGSYSNAETLGDVQAEPQPILKIDAARSSLIQNVFIATPIAGVVGSVDVKEGQLVKDGTRLAQLDDQQAATELEAARAAFQAADLESKKDVNKRYAERTLRVHELELMQNLSANQKLSGSVSKLEVEKSRMVVDQARLAIEQAEYDLMVAGAKAKEQLAAVKISEAKVEKHAIQSTVSGMVSEVDVEAGEWVEAGKPIVRVISLDPIRVECFVDGRKHGMELIGHPVRFIPKVGASAAELGDTYVGKVTFVSPELHAVTGQARLWATVDNPKLKIRAGMQGQLIIDAK